MRNVNLGQLPDGDLVIVSDQTLPCDVKRVEYYRDQKLFMLVYANDDHEGDLMHYELADDVARKVERKTALMIIEPDKISGEPMGYYTSLIQVGA
jgi:hypothetical protein